MQAHPIRCDTHLPLADLKDFGCDFSFIPPTARFFNPNELLMGMRVPGDDEDEESEVTKDESKDEEDATDEVGKGVVRNDEVGPRVDKLAF